MSNPQCPYCYSTDTYKTTDSWADKSAAFIAGTAVKFATQAALGAVGINGHVRRPAFEKDVQWVYQCNSCGHTFKKGDKPSVSSLIKTIIVKRLEVDEAEITEQASFTNDLGADSLDIVELIMEFEKVFGVTIPDDQAEKITTVGEAIAFIEQNR